MFPKSQNEYPTWHAMIILNTNPKSRIEFVSTSIIGLAIPSLKLE